MKRLQPTSPAPPALENDDLLAEFLLRLPPQPSTLPRVGLVCNRWRRVVTDPQFIRRFRAFHRRTTPPLHGFITRSGLFFPAQQPPDRLPPTHFWPDRWFLSDGGEIVRFDLGTRSLSVIEQRPHRPEMRIPWMWGDFKSWILPPTAAGDGDCRRFCLAVLCGFSIEFWEREAELSDAAAEWVLCKTVQLLDKKVLPVEFEAPVPVHALPLGICGFDEESNTIFLWTRDGVRS